MTAQDDESSLFGIAFRSLFAAGAVHAVLAMLAWFTIAEARRVGAPLPLAAGVPPSWVHAHAMFFGTFAFFVFGFLGTAFPRWVGAAPPGPTTTKRWLALLVAAQLLWFAAPGVHRGLHVAAAAIELVAWMALLRFLARALRGGASPARAQPALVLGAVALAPVAVACDAFAFARTEPAAHVAARTIALHGFLLLLVGGVAVRVVPFFLAGALGRAPAPRPVARVFVWAGLGGARVALSVLAPAIGADADAVAPIVAALDLALGLLVAAEIAAWRPGRAAWRNPMLAVLLLALVWIALALVASGAVGLLAPAAAPRFELPLRHSLAVGGLATLLVGMSARIVLGHSGRPIVADARLIAMFAAIQLAALTRVGLPLLGDTWPAAPLWSHWGAVPWTVAWALWLWRLGPRALRPQPVTAAP